MTRAKSPKGIVPFLPQHLAGNTDASAVGNDTRDTIDPACRLDGFFHRGVISDATHFTMAPEAGRSGGCCRYTEINDADLGAGRHQGSRGCQAQSGTAARHKRCNTLDIHI